MKNEPLIESSLWVPETACRNWTMVLFCSIGFSFCQVNLPSFNTITPFPTSSAMSLPSQPLPPFLPLLPELFPLLLFSSASPSFAFLIYFALFLCFVKWYTHTHYDFDVTHSYIMKVMQVRLCTVDVCTLLLSTFWNAQLLWHI